MSIAGFPYLVILLNLEDPEYLVHVSSVFIFSLRVCDRNWPLCICPLQLLNSSLYWYSGTIQLFSSLDQVKQFILTYGSVPDQVTKEFSSSLYNPPQRDESIFYTDTSTFSDHLITTIADVPSSRSWLLFTAPSESEYYIHIDSWLSYL